MEHFVYVCAYACYYMTQSLSREAQSRLAARDSARWLWNGKIQGKGHKSTPQAPN